MELDPRDVIMRELAPLLPMPRYTPRFTPLAATGHRYIVAEDGLWIEVKRPWLHAVWSLGESKVPLPYGPMPVEEYTFAFDEGALVRLLDTFVAMARQAMPNECAAWGVWNEQSRTLEFRPCIAIDAGPAGVHFHRPLLAPHEHFAVDIHSHGRLAAGFSPTDDHDDRGEVKLAVVIGRLDHDSSHIAMRLCLMGLFIDFSSGRCRVCGCTDEEPCTLGCHWVELDLCSRCAA